MSPREPSTVAPHPAGDEPLPGRSYLAPYLALACGALIVYASLQPFQDWTARPRGMPFFLFAPLPAYQRWADVWFNVVAYAPFGFFVALAHRGDGRPMGTTPALGAALALSFVMEVLQMWLPHRVASTIDLVANGTGGALGGLLAWLLHRHPRVPDALLGWRNAAFIGGRLGDLGLTLLGAWLLAHVNPAIPLFSTSFDAALPASIDPADYVVEASEIAFNLIGVCLFIGLLLRHRAHMGLAVAALIGASLALKSVAAANMLTPEAWGQWLHPTVTLGMAAGLVTLLAVVGLPRGARTVICAIALLASPLTQLIASELVFAPDVLPLFDWRYGQLTNFNGLTQALLLLWPGFVSLHLLALSGKPRWGEE